MTGSYICDTSQPGCPDAPTNPCAHLTGHCWHESTRRRLEWQYGENRINAADISAWNTLGQRREIAA